MASLPTKITKQKAQKKKRNKGLNTCFHGEHVARHRKWVKKKKTAKKK